MVFCEWQQFGNLIATRIPAAQFSAQTLPYPADGGVRSMPRVCASLTLDLASGPVRMMTTHLEFYSPIMRLAHVHALRALHADASGHATAPPLGDETGWPFQSKPHAARCILAGDFNFETHDDEYALVQLPYTSGTTAFKDAWVVANQQTRHAPTFRLYDRRYSPEPITCDFVFVTEDIAPQVRVVRVDLDTRVSDNQPVLLEIDL